MESPHIFLVGMMGSGKSTLGRGLAAALGLPFQDLDEAIEERTQRTIASLFERPGEFGFRACEAQMLRELPTRFARSVIATGGGAPMHFDSMSYMMATGTTAYLRLEMDALAGRLESARAERPLLAKPDWRASTEALLSLRRSVYERSDVIVDTGGQTPADSLKLLVTKLR